MGDVAMTVPVLVALQKDYPDINIIFLTKKQFSPIFHNITNVMVHGVDVSGAHKGFFGILKIFRELKQYNVDAVIDLHNVLRSNILKVLFTMLGVNVASLDKGRKEKKKLTQWSQSKEFYQLKSTHQRYAHVFNMLGMSLSIAKASKLSKLNPPKEFESRKKILIGIAPFASFKGKAYPLSFVKKTISLLLEVLDCQLLLFGGGKNETLKLQKLADHFGEEVENVAGKLQFQEELALISNLDLMLSMDSGNGHLAANYGVPVVTIWGVTHPFLGFVPFGQPLENQLMADREEYPLIPTSVYGNKNPKGYEKAIETVSPERVAQKISEVIVVK